MCWPDRVSPASGNHTHAYSRPPRIFWPGLGYAINIHENVYWDVHADHLNTTTPSGNHTHAAAIGTSGAGAPIDNRPAFYALAFLMKL